MGETVIVAAVCRAGGGCGLQFLSAAGETVGFIPTRKAVRSFDLVSADGGPVQDVLAIVGSEAVLIQGESLLSGAPVVQTLPVSGAVAATAGSFLYSFRTGPQLAVLDANATLHLLSRSALNPHQLTSDEVRLARKTRTAASAGQQIQGAWLEVENTPNYGTGAADPTLLKGHFTANGQDDLLLLSRGQSFRLSHPSIVKDGFRRSEAVVTVDSTGETAVAALAMRVSADSRMGLVTIDQSGRPLIAVPTSFRTYNVNTAADAVPSAAARTACSSNLATGCTLRAAIALTNADASQNLAAGTIDTINVAAGTYTTLATNGTATDRNGDRNYHYNLDGPVNIIGASQAGTILDANSLDNVFDINSGVVNAFSTFDVFLSNLTLRNGLNQNNPITSVSSYNFVGGLISWESYGPGYLTLANVSLLNSKVMYGGGGALGSSNSNGPSDGPLELDNSTISGNSTAETGGGLSVGVYNPLVLLSTNVTGNSALTSTVPSDTNALGEGGGIATSGGSNTRPDTIANSIISGNRSTIDGGGLLMLNGFSMSGTTVSGNTAGMSAGGLYYLPFNTAANIASSNFVTNQITSGDGAGICYGLQTTKALSLTMHYSRIHANVGGAHTGLAIGCNAASGFGTVVATDNWWGCNGPASGAGCDTAGTTPGSTVTSGSTTLTPFTTLTETLSSATPGYGAVLTATGSLGQDSAGTVYAAANDTAYAGVAATNVITQGGASTSSTATKLNASGAIVTTAQASASGSATVTVDGTSITRSFTYTLPTTTTVGPVSTPNQVGNSTTVTVSVTDPANASDVVQTGTVTLYDTVASTRSTLATVSLNGSNSVSYSYTQSMGGSHTITAAFTPASGTAYVASADTTGQTFTVTPGTLSSPTIVSTVQVGAPLTVKPGSTLLLTINFLIPGTLAPTGALTVTVDNSPNGVLLNGCAYKVKHANCSVSYVGSSTTGGHTFAFTQAADANYTAVSGTATITVSQ